MFGSKPRDEDRKLYDEAVKVKPLSLDEEALAIAKLVTASDHFRQPIATLILDLVRDEHYLFDPPPLLDGVTLTLTEGVFYRNFLRLRISAGKHKDTQHLLRRTVALLASFDSLPQTDAGSPFTVPLVDALPDLKQFIARIYVIVFNDELRSRGLFGGLRSTLEQNIAAISKGGKIVLATESDLPPRELRHAYLKNTPFDDFLDTPVPIKFSHDDRFSHMHVLGGTGAGKTTLLENIILHDLKSKHRPSLVVVDSQGDLIRKISHLAIFNKELAHALVIISPKDIANPPALNIFHVNRDRLGKYDEATREQVTAGVIQTFEYLFAGLLGADLTAKQGVFFKHVARLMLSLPETLGRNATILDMIHLMDDAGPYQKAIEALPPIPRDFFQRDFASKTFQQTKEQIRYRLHAIIENPTLARLFTSPTTKVDLFKELNSGSVILVDTAKDFLKGSSAHFGQIFISLVLQAVLERAALPESQRKHSFLIIDEAAEYFDSNIDDLLTEARKQKLGCVFAHQYLDQCTSALRASLAANTSIKFAGGVSTGDARSLAPEMRTTPDFILSLKRLHFAAHVRNIQPPMPHAVSVPVQIGLLDKEEQLTTAQYEALLVRNRARVSLQSTASPSPSTPPDDDVAPTW